MHSTQYNKNVIKFTRKDAKVLKKLKQTSRQLPLFWTLAIAVLLAGCITLLALWCQPNALRTVLVIFKAQPLLIVLNAMPVGLLVLLFTCLTRNVCFGAALTNLIVCGFSIANRVKIEVRDEPVFPRDLALLKEVGSIVSDYDIHYPLSAIAVVVLASLALVVLGFFLRCKPFPAKKLQGWRGSLLGAAASLAVLAGLIVTVYASNDLYNSFKTSNPYYVPAVFNELGFPYCFCHQFTTYPVDKPEGFSKGQAELWEQETPPATPGKEPQNIHVIMVMNEAFSDVTDHDSFAYTEADDPLRNLHHLQEHDNTIASGHLVVPNFAAGTANTEFDVLTGIQTNALSATTTSSFRVVNRNLDSLFRVYGNAGYHTAYYHPGDDWFYNRENVLDWMGADETRFLAQMPDFEAKGRWVTDDYMADKIEEAFEASVAAGEPLFLYTTTIQNHMSYTEDKYGADYVYPEVPLNISVSEQTASMAKVYAEGAQDADAMLGRLCDYFSQREEPVMLVFFGDHLPYLGDNQSGYKELGFTEDEHWDDLTSYEVPYLIWRNDAAAEPLQDAASPGETISAAFLGAAVLEMTGHAAQSSWFTFLNDAMLASFPVIQKNTAVQSDGRIVNPYLLDDHPPMQLTKWRQWSYYKLKYQEFDS